MRVRFVGEDGNAYAILGRVVSAFRRAKVGKEEIDKFLAEATSGDYYHLLRTCMAWVADDDDYEDEDEEDEDND